MTSNVVNIADFRRPATTPPEQYPTDEELAKMRYGAVLDWAGADFDRLVAVARARDYRPQWIVHQLAERGRTLTGPEHAIMDRLVADAGEYLTRRQRWIMRQLRTRPGISQSALAELAAKAPEFRGFKRPDLCIGHDIAKLVEMGLVKTREKISDAGDSGVRSQSGATPR
jgi:hypothetical protein